MTSPPTEWPEVNRLLADLLRETGAVLGERWVGTYLCGSLALGDFVPDTSDVDFLTVTEARLAEADVKALAARHARIAAGPSAWARRLEGSYVPRTDVRRQPAGLAWHPALRIDGTFSVDGHGSEWVLERHVLREHGVVLHGPHPRTLIDPVGPDDLCRAVRGLLAEWWAPQLTDLTHLAAADYRAYAVLSMCRALHTLETSALSSKPAAARWAIATFGPRWAPLVARARDWRPGRPFEALPEILDLIRFTLSRAGIGSVWGQTPN